MALNTGDVEITIRVESDSADVTLTSRPRDGADLSRVLPDLGHAAALAHARSAAPEPEPVDLAVVLGERGPRS